MFRFLFAAMLSVAAFTSAESFARADAPKTKTSSAAGSLHLPVERFTLANGLRVVLHADSAINTVAISVFYDVGSRNEVPGRTGFAHMFEHMMFQGSANVARNEHPKLVVSRGGTLNAGTSNDLTVYFEVLPANEIALGLWLEADRMRSLDVSLESFHSQREVVKEEVLGGLSYPTFRASRRREELVLQSDWSYAHSTGGLVEDLDRAELSWLAEFHARYYGPNNAVLSVAGNIDIPAVTALIHKYFDNIPRISPPSYVPAPPAPEPQASRTEIMHDAALSSPAVLYGWAIPFTRHPDHYPLAMVTSLLSEGEGSRLHKRLVVDKELAQSIYASLEVVRRGPDMLTIDAKPAEKASLKDIEQAIENELTDLAKHPLSATEMQGLQKRMQAKQLFKLRSNMDRASTLGYYELLFGDARLVEEEPARYAAVTAKDLQRVVAKYLTPQRQVRIEVLPKETKK